MPRLHEGETTDLAAYEEFEIMSTTLSAFQKIPRDETLAAAVRSLQVALQAELLRAGAQWEESLAILRESANHRRAFSSAAEALSWYRSAYHPAV